LNHTCHRKMILRTCTMCGLEAHTPEDLELFRKNSDSVHGRENICKSCYNSINKRYGKRQKRWYQLVENFQKPIRCAHCGEEITDLDGTRDPQSLAIHSVDGNHENWNPMNKMPMHLECHSSFHNAGEKNPRYKGESTNGAS